MLKYVAPQYRIQWETFSVKDTFETAFKVNLGAITVSEDMLDLMLSFETWSGIRYADDDGNYKIGYGIGDPNEEQGYTETESYVEWVGWVRNKQKNLRDQLPIVSAPQSVFDALLSLYLDTGSWKTVIANEGVYDLNSAIKDSNWLLCADIISRGKINPLRRKKEAAVLMLSDYNITKDRNQQIVQGVQQLRSKYVSGIRSDFEKKQAEFVYYRQLGTFLPGMSDLRKRRIIAQART